MDKGWWKGEGRLVGWGEMGGKGKGKGGKGLRKVVG